MSRFSLRVRLGLLAVAVVLVGGAASAQPAWRSSPLGPTVSVDAMVALGDDFEATFLSPEGLSLPGSVDLVSSALMVTARVPVGGGVSVVADLPFSYARFTNPDVPVLGIEGGVDDDLTVGNPYVGAEAEAAGALTLGGGVRLPLSRFDRTDGFLDRGQFGQLGGFTADPEQFEAYLPEALTVSALARYEPRVGPVGLRFMLAPAYIVDTSSDEFLNDPPRTGLALGYGAQAEVAAGPVTLFGGVLGRPVLTGERFELFSVNAMLAAGATVTVGRVRPGVLVRLPIDRDPFPFESDATVGLSLDVPLR